MNPLSGGFPSRRRAPAVTPPSSSSSSSSLSPLAPPFTVDRPFPLAPTAPSLYAPPPSDLASTAVGSRFITTTPGVLDPSPCYPSYDSNPNNFPRSGSGDFKPFEGLVFGGERSSGFDGRSSWIDPSSCYRVSPLRKDAPIVQTGNLSSLPRAYNVGSESYQAIQRGNSGVLACENAPTVQTGNLSSLPRAYHVGSESYPAIHRGNSDVFPSSFKSSAVLAPNAFSNEVSDALSADPSSMAETHNKFYQTSSYDDYLTQLALTHKPLVACLPLKQEYDPVERTISPTDLGALETGFSTIQYVNPSRMYFDYLETMPTEQKESGTYQSDDNVYADLLNRIRTCFPNSTFVETSNIIGKGNGSAAGKSMEQSLEVNYGSNHMHLNCPDSSTSESYSVKPHDLKMIISSDSLDQHNLGVDSPCWKRTPASHEYIFGSEGNDSSKVARGSTVCRDLQQDQKHLQADVKYAGTYPEHIGSSICQENQHDHSLSYTKEPSYAVSLPGRGQKCEDDIDVKLIPVETGNKVSHVANVLVELTNEETNDLLADSGPKAYEFIQSNQQENVSPGNESTLVAELVCPGLKEAVHDSSAVLNACAKYNINKVSSYGDKILRENATVPGSSDLSCSRDSGNVQLLIKSMYNLSQVLLGTCSNDHELKEPEVELLQLVIENLKAVRAKDKKVELNTDETDNIMKLRNTKSSHKMDCIWQTANDDKPIHFIPKSIETDIAKCIAQALDNLPDNSYFDQEEESRTLLYKNLWIEAEVALCTMKYELQLARMKLKMENQKLEQKANSNGSSDEVKFSELTRLRSLSSTKALDDHYEERNKAKQGICNASAFGADGTHSGDEQPSGGGTDSTDDADASVMARCRVLKGHLDNMNSLVESNFKQHHDVKTSMADEVDSAVMTRLRVLKGRVDNASSECSSMHPILQHSVDLGVHLETEETMGSLSSATGSFTGTRHQVTELANLDLMRQNQQTSADHEHENVCNLVNSSISSDPQISTSYSEEVGPFPNYAWFAAASGSPACIADGPSSQGRQITSSDPTNSSSEWDYVLKEDIFSFNSS
ncbi:uncharacterized protein [Typha latifolia]|uniref:uncharacterized protein n=1 Tax=Typha latifolia TaxID=4733 RepID=UPI003C2E230C